MKFSLRSKLFAGFVLLNLTVSCLLGYFMYRASSEMFFEEFREHNLSIARFLSAAIDGDRHVTYTSVKSFHDPQYKGYIHLLNTVNRQEPAIRYLYTLNFDRRGNKLYYALDGMIPDYDMGWIETDQFAFSFFINEKGELCAEYNNIITHNGFTAETDEGTVKVDITAGPNSAILINGAEILKIRAPVPLIVETRAGILDKDNKKLEFTTPLFGKEMQFTLSFSVKGEPGSEPGAEFIEKPEIVNKVRNLILEGRDFVDPVIIKNAYGKFISAYSPIRNSLGIPVGLVTVDINTRDVALFREKVTRVALIVFLSTFALSLVLSVFLARHLSGPLSLLMKAVNDISTGNLSATVPVTSADEIGLLARSFNDMVRNLASASEEQKRLIQEISLFNQNLEERVAEKTETVIKQAVELNRQMMIARAIQMALLPDKTPDLKNMTVSFKYRPMMAIGGDFIDFSCTGNELTLFICDVSGHGVPAALLAAMVKMSFMSCCADGDPPGRLLLNMHASLRDKLSGHFLSAAVCRINLETGEMVSSNAGHPPFIRVRRGGSIDFIKSPGRIICGDFDPNTEEVFTKLEPGDSIVLFTDGLIEVRNLEGMFFGENRLIDTISTLPHLQAKDLCNEIYDSMERFSGLANPEYDDDITLLVAEYSGTGTLD